MKNTLNGKTLRAENGGSIPVELLDSPEFQGVKLATPFWSVGFSQDGDGPKLGERFDWHEGSFIVVKLGVSNWQGQSSFTAMAVANA
jgi:hypothetical protein